MQTIQAIEELLRLPSPAPAPQALACDGKNLWMGSLDTQRIYGIDSLHGSVFEELQAPGEPIGMTVTGDALRVVLSEKDDHRFIRRYIFGHGFKTNEAVACPDDTGSFLAYDGDRLYLSQRHSKKILTLDDTGTVTHTISVPREITGMVVADGYFYLATSAGKDSGDFRLTRLDARKDTPEIVDLATFPFEARSLAYDGERFWTNQRWENEIVAFRKPE